MKLEIKEAHDEDVLIIGLIGSLDTNTAPEAENVFNQWLEKDTKKMVVNLEETKYISSAGLRVFLATTKKITAAGGAVKFCSPNEVVKEILDISGFTVILDVKATMEEALSSLK